MKSGKKVKSEVEREGWILELDLSRLRLWRYWSKREQVGNSSILLYKRQIWPSRGVGVLERVVKDVRVQGNDAAFGLDGKLRREKGLDLQPEEKSFRIA